MRAFLLFCCLLSAINVSAQRAFKPNYGSGVIMLRSDTCTFSSKIKIKKRIVLDSRFPEVWQVSVHDTIFIHDHLEFMRDKAKKEATIWLNKMIKEQLKENTDYISVTESFAEYRFWDGRFQVYDELISSRK